jgi:hypothetical protein
MSDYNILATNSLVQWDAFYAVINACNSVVEFAPKVLALDETYTEAAMKVDVAQAKAIRAWMYFSLARLYKDVPLKLTATNADEDFVPIAKNTQLEILTQVVKDLTEADVDIPTVYGAIDKNHSRVTKGMVNTMLADAYLWLDKPQEALDATNKVIALNQYGLSTSISTIFDGNSVEGIFEIAYGFDVTSGYNNTSSVLFSQFGLVTFSSKRFQANNFLIEEVFPDDAFNSDTNYDLRAPEAFNSASMVITKYNRSSATAPFNFIVYRYSDVLLLKAEALALLNKGTEALTIINQIRTRAKAISTTERVVDSSNQDDVLNYVLAERSREFAFEGKRWFDLVRFAKRNGYKRLDILTAAIMRTVSSDRLQTALSKLKDANSHYLPIYQRELNANKLLVQNPFYK